MGSNLFLSPTTNSAVNHLIANLDEIRKKAALTPISILLPTANTIHLQQTEDPLYIILWTNPLVGYVVVHEPKKLR